MRRCASAHTSDYCPSVCTYIAVRVTAREHWGSMYRDPTWKFTNYLLHFKHYPQLKLKRVEAPPPPFSNKPSKPNAADCSTSTACSTVSTKSCSTPMARTPFSTQKQRTSLRS